MLYEARRVCRCSDICGPASWLMGRLPLFWTRRQFVFAFPCFAVRIPDGMSAISRGSARCERHPRKTQKKHSIPEGSQRAPHLFRKSKPQMVRQAPGDLASPEPKIVPATPRYEENLGAYPKTSTGAGGSRGRSPFRCGKTAVRTCSGRASVLASRVFG